MPIAPPMRQMITLSTTNCRRILLFVAPRAFLVPISRVRSVTETSMMFITPIPPTRSEIPAMTEMATERVLIIESTDEIIVSMLMAVTV